MEQIGRIEACAYKSIGRACLFGYLAIALVVFSLIAWPSLSMRSGAYLSGLTAAFLVLRGFAARTYPVHRTETWLLLGNRPAQRAAPMEQQVIGQVLRDVYFRFGLWSGAAGALMLLLSFVFRWLGR